MVRLSCTSMVLSWASTSQGHILRPVVIGHIPEKRARQNGQDQNKNSTGDEPFFAPGHGSFVHSGAPHCSSWGRYPRMV